MILGTYTFLRVHLKGILKGMTTEGKISFPSPDLYTEWVNLVNLNAARGKADFLVMQLLNVSYSEIS